ncbi:MAG: hypothetical protein ACFCVC_01340 [Acidimicrobiia bacterium]
MSFDPAPGSSGVSAHTSSRPDPAREVREMARLLVDSAERLAAASDLVVNAATARSLGEMGQMRRTASDTVIALAADAGVVVRNDATGSAGGVMDQSTLGLPTGDDSVVIEVLLARDDRLVVRLDAAQGGDLPPMVKEQLRLTGAQVRDGLRSMATWVGSGS